MAAKSGFEAALAAQRLVAVVRLTSGSALVDVAQALRAGGLQLIEFTLNTPGAVAGLQQAAAAGLPGVCLGAGTVLDAAAAGQAIQAGVQFVVTPVLKLDVIAACRRYGVPCVAGAYTPTEMQTAWEAGADVVKVFPATSLGPAYLKDVLAPLPHLRLLPTGGITLENAPSFLAAGAVAVGVGGQLVDSTLVRQGNWEALAERARRFVAVCGAPAA